MRPLCISRLLLVVSVEPQRVERGSESRYRGNRFTVGEQDGTPNLPGVEEEAKPILEGPGERISRPDWLAQVQGENDGISRSRLRREAKNPVLSGQFLLDDFGKWTRPE